MNIYPQARNNGIFLGIILIVFSIVLSYVNPRMFLASQSFILMVPFVLVLIKNAFDIRRIQGGWISFKSLFYNSFVCAMIAISFCSVFEYFLFNSIFPDLKDIYREISIEALKTMKGTFSEEMIDKSMEEIEKDNFYGPIYIIMLFLRRIIAPGLLLSLFVSYFLKKSKPTTQT